MKIAVLVNTDKPKAIQCAKDIAEMFLKTDTKVLMLSENKSLFTGLDITYYDLIEEIFDNCNIECFPEKNWQSCAEPTRGKLRGRKLCERSR